VWHIVEQWIQLFTFLRGYILLAYIIANFDCIPKDDGFLDVPEPAPPVEDDFDVPAPQDGKEEEEFDESQRKPIWWNRRFIEHIKN